MASLSTRTDLKALYRLINQADLVLGTIPDSAFNEATVVAHGRELSAVMIEASAKGEEFPRITGTSETRELIGILRDA
jgi:hypothetical protein